MFQYNCTNTIPEQLLENVSLILVISPRLFAFFFSTMLLSCFSFCQVMVVVDASDAEEFSEVTSKPLRSLPFDSPGQTYVAFEKPEGVISLGKFSNMLRFIVKEVVILPTCGKMNLQISF